MPPICDHELWSSNLNAARDLPGTFTKFAPPTVVNGRVYVPTLSNAVAGVWNIDHYDVDRQCGYFLSSQQRELLGGSGISR